MQRRSTTSLRPRTSLAAVRSKLIVTASVCLTMTAFLALAVAHSRAPYGFEEPALQSLTLPSAKDSWEALANLLAAPAIGAALVVSFTLGYVRRAFPRIATYAVFATAALLVNENLGKPLVQRTYNGNLTFPSGHVTAVSATALAMWLALYPLLGKRVRSIALVLGVAGTLLISLAVVGAQWHTPLDAVGSILLSVGIVTARGAVLKPVATQGPFIATERARIGERGGG
jgi:membrane-associated phospholipid phosphatase